MTKKRGLIILMLTLTAVSVFLIGYIAGGTRQASIGIDSSISIASLALEYLDRGDTNTVEYILEENLIGLLNWHDALESQTFHLRSAFFRKHSGSDWQARLNWANNRVKAKRDRYNYFLNNPAELKREFAKTFTKALHNAGHSNATATVREEGSSSVTLSIDGVIE